MEQILILIWSSSSANALEDDTKDEPVIPLAQDEEIIREIKRLRTDLSRDGVIPAEQEPHINAAPSQPGDASSAPV